VVTVLAVPCRLVRGKPAPIDGAILDREHLRFRLQSPTREPEGSFVMFDGVKLTIDPWGELLPQVIPAFQAHVTMARAHLTAARTKAKRRDWQALLEQREHRLAAALKYQASKGPDALMPPGRCRAESPLALTRDRSERAVSIGTHPKAA
jgi:hypothetical protein